MSEHCSCIALNHPLHDPGQCDEPRGNAGSVCSTCRYFFMQAGNMKHQRVYIAGPMTGIPQFNIPAFDSLATLLRAKGYDVVSPAELDGAESRSVIMASATGDHADLPPGETWGFYLARDVRLLADDGIEAVIVLPGWGKSKGARLETFVARALLGLPVLHSDTLEPVATITLVANWLGGELWSGVKFWLKAFGAGDNE